MYPLIGTTHPRATKVIQNQEIAHAETFAILTIILLHRLNDSLRWVIGISEEMQNASVGIVYSPRRNGKILRNFHFILPKFHFILPKFYLPSPWGIFAFSGAIRDSLRGRSER